MIYKTQQFTNQELEDLVKGLSVMKAESVKEGDTPVYSDYNNTLSKTELISEIWNKSGETIADVGEVRQALNEKGEKLWYCPECKEIKESEIEFMKSHHLRFCFKLGTKKPKKIKFAKPLLVRLEEIEKKRAEEMHGFHQWLETFKMVEK